jgi:hypothetical protein
VASRSPLQGFTGCGGLQRNSPTGAAAKGIPLKMDTSPSVTPRTIPEAVFTFGAAISEDCPCKLFAMNIENMIITFLNIDILAFYTLQRSFLFSPHLV